MSTTKAYMSTQDSWFRSQSRLGWQSTEGREQSAQEEALMLIAQAEPEMLCRSCGNTTRDETSWSTKKIGERRCPRCHSTQCWLTMEGLIPVEASALADALAAILPALSELEQEAREGR